MKRTQQINIIPKPLSLKLNEGSFNLNPKTKIIVNPGTKEIRKIGKMLAEIINSETGHDIKVMRSSKSYEKENIYLQIKSTENSLGEEGCKLVVTKNKITFFAFKAAGLFRGIQTLRQIFPSSRNNSDKTLDIPACRITDKPRFKWRGMMLDVARHFFTVQEIKRFIDLIAFYKINKLHIHLTDDQGWRIEINSWKKLALYGGSTQVGGGKAGYYSKKEFSEIVSYAQDRYITIIPEIDMPGHTNAALASYKELNNNNTSPPLYTDIQVGFSALAIRKKITYQFINDVIKEISKISTSEFIHIGGDEAKQVTPEDYIYFIDKVKKIIKKHGKKMIGWEEISNADLDSTSIVQHWKSDIAKSAVKQGAKIIMSPASKTYFDIKYDPSTKLGQNWAGYNEVKDSYNWDPANLVKGINEKNIIGVEGALWTETIKTFADIEYMVFPRFCCFAEIGWTPKSGKNWNEFKSRLAKHARQLDKLGINFYRSSQILWKDDKN